MSVDELVSIVDATYCLKWELSKEAFDGRESDSRIFSPKYTLKIGNKETVWRMNLSQQVNKRKNGVSARISLNLLSPGSVFTVRYAFAIQTVNGMWPSDHVQNWYSHLIVTGRPETVFDTTIEPQYGRGYSVGSVEDFTQRFVDNKMNIVATVKLLDKGKSYIDQLKIIEKFVSDVRSQSDQEDLCDYTIMCNEKSFKCSRLLLASRSRVFQAKFKHDTTDKTEMVLKIDDSSPDTVEAMLQYMSKGVVPKDIDKVAMDLISLADVYGLDMLVEVCASSLVQNLSVRNAAETLVVIDKHVPNSKHREAVINFIEGEAEEIVKSKDWKTFSREYPDLVTDLFLSSCKRKASLNSSV